MRNNIKYYINFFVLVLMIACIGCEKKKPMLECSDAIGCLSLSPGEPIKIIALYVLSGGPKAIGQDQVRGAQLAIEDRAGNLMDHPIMLKEMDDLCSKEGGSIAAQQIISDIKVTAILGTYCSGAAIPAARIMSEAGLSMISSGNTAPTLTSVNGMKGGDNQPGYFRTSHNDEILGKVAAKFAFDKLGKRKVGTINDGDPYTKGLTLAFEKAFKTLGGEIAISETINKGDMDMQPVLNAVSKSSAELVFYPLFQPEGDYITKQAKAMKSFDHITLMSADGLMSEGFVKSVGQDGKGMYFIGPANPAGPMYKNFVSKYLKKFGERPIGPFHAHAYDAMNMLLDAIAFSAIKQADGGLYIQRQGLRDALKGTSGYKGITGNLSCDQFGDCGAPRIKVVRLDNPETGFQGLSSNIVYVFESSQQE